MVAASRTTQTGIARITAHPIGDRAGHRPGIRKAGSNRADDALAEVIQAAAAVWLQRGTGNMFHVVSHDQNPGLPYQTGSECCSAPRQ